MALWELAILTEIEICHLPPCLVGVSVVSEMKLLKPFRLMVGEKSSLIWILGGSVEECVEQSD